MYLYMYKQHETTFLTCLFIYFSLPFEFELCFCNANRNTKHRKYSFSPYCVGLGFRPMPPHENVESTLIWYKGTNYENYRTWTDALDRFLASTYKFNRESIECDVNVKYAVNCLNIVAAAMIQCSEPIYSSICRRNHLDIDLVSKFQTKIRSYLLHIGVEQRHRQAFLLNFTVNCFHLQNNENNVMPTSEL